MFLDMGWSVEEMPKVEQLIAVKFSRSEKRSKT